MLNHNNKQDAATSARASHDHERGLTHHIVFLLHPLQQGLHGEEEGGWVGILTVLDNKLLEMSKREQSLFLFVFFIKGLKRKTKEKTTRNTTQQGDRKVH